MTGIVLDCAVLISFELPASSLPLLYVMFKHSCLTQYSIPSRACVIGVHFGMGCGCFSNWRGLLSDHFTVDMLRCIFSAVAFPGVLEDTCN